MIRRPSGFTPSLAPVNLLAQALALACICWSASAQSLSTRSFTNANVGSDPRSLRQDGNSIVVDLAAIRGATVFRATLDPYALPKQSRQGFDIRDASGAKLQLVAPRYVAFDATDAVRAALPTGTLTLTIGAGSRPVGRTLSLDVLCDRPAPRPVPQVTATEARNQDGETMITFAEIDPPRTSSTWTVGEHARAKALFDHDRSPKRRYRIYRSRVPFTDARTVAAAEFIDELQPLSGWNAGLHGFDPTFGKKDDLVIPTLPVADRTLSIAGTGVHVHAHRDAAAESAWYLVSHTLDGAEDFSRLIESNNTSERVDEAPGSGMTLLWREERAAGNWSHGRRVDANLRYYVRWASPPDANLPSEPNDYRLGVPDALVARPPLEIRPPPWNATLEDPRDWSLYDEGSLLLTFNLLRYNSYTAHHECAGTLRAYDDGTVQPFFQARLLDFVFGFLAPTYGIDTERIHMRGESMGAAAAHLWGMRSGHLFASLVAAVGNNIPAEDLAKEFVGVGEWGPIAWRSLYTNPQLVRFGYREIRASDGVVVWDYFDNAQWLVANRGIDTPHITYSNSPSDIYISWQPAWKVTQAMTATQRPFNFSWGPRGHLESIQDLGVSIRLHESLPAFSHNSMDDDLGASPSDSAPVGQLNRYLRWTPGSVVDTSTNWEVEILLAPFAPGTGCTTDVTPRRLQRLLHAPGQSFVWRLMSGTTVESCGAVVADADGLFTIPGVRFTKQPRRLVLERADRATLSASRHCLTGDESEKASIKIDAGVQHAGRGYLVRAALVRTFPAATIGVPLDDAPTAPLEVFTGVLDAVGRATFPFGSPARLDATTTDSHVDLALTLIGPCSSHANPLRIEIGAVHDPTPAADAGDPTPIASAARAGLLVLGLGLFTWMVMRRRRSRTAAASEPSHAGA